MLTTPDALGESIANIGSAVGKNEQFGLYAAFDFRITDGHCADCATIPQALWYFACETIAVPKPGLPVAGFAKGVSVADDLRSWLGSRSPEERLDYPPLVWVAAPDVIDGATLTQNASLLRYQSRTLDVMLAPKIDLNRSYFDPSSADYFADRAVRIRGHHAAGKFVVRTLWPAEFRVTDAPPRALDADVPVPEALRRLVRAEPAGGARSAFAASTLWQRDPAQRLAPGRAVLGLMLNGAQGDDDEAHGGHFALVTGRVQPDGAVGDWLVNNFYALDNESEKGIIAAPVPLDNYLADLNSGQSWYRPSQLLVAVLGSDRAPALVQGATNRVYNQFYRHQLHYRHATMNCTGISIDVLRAIGWPIPVRGAASRLLAAIGFPYFALKERSIDKASLAFDYLYEDMTRLMPAAAFEETGASLLSLAKNGRKGKTQGTLADMLAADIEALLFVHVPQFPSSRVFGDAPAVTPFEFHTRIPRDPGMVQVVPVPSRPFPDALRDDDLLPAKRPASTYAAAIWGVVLLVAIAALLWAIVP